MTTFVDISRLESGSIVFNPKDGKDYIVTKGRLKPCVASNWDALKHIETAPQNTASEIETVKLILGRLFPHIDISEGPDAVAVLTAELVRRYIQKQTQ